MEFSNGRTTSIAATTASNGTASNAAPHRKNAPQRTRTDSPYQQRTSQKDNPTQVIIKQAVDYLIQQLEAGKSETLESGWLSPELAIGIRGVKGVKRLGRRIGNWLTGDQAQKLLNAVFQGTLRGRRGAPVIALLLG
jgi:hypothetical protein